MLVVVILKLFNRLLYSKHVERDRWLRLHIYTKIFTIDDFY